MRGCSAFARHRRRQHVRNALLALAIAGAVGVGYARAQIPRLTLPDRPGDEMPRPTDPGALIPVDPLVQRLPDLTGLQMGRWTPAAPTEDLFMGDYDTNGAFLRIDVSFTGLLNPPGPVGDGQFEPFMFGPHPVYGFVEIDMDRDTATGGEVAAPQFRYLTNASRFGGKPAATRFADRAATDGDADDRRLSTMPFIERHGEEFHLALLGGQFAASDVSRIRGDGDWLFEEDEVWDIRGRFFHRAHGFEPFSFAKGGRHAGEYAPRTDLRFRHSTELGATFVSLVFPLTNAGAGLMRGEEPEKINNNSADHTSVYEGLVDLELSALFIRTIPTGQEDEVLITGWADKNPVRFLDPTEWTATAIFGTSAVSPPPSGVAFIWTDILPNVVRGDFNGSGECTDTDMALLDAFIAQRDPLDGANDAAVRIGGFAAAYSVFDINYDGYVNEMDRRIAKSPGDGDDDGDVDLADFGGLQNCFDLIEDSLGNCGTADMNGDTSVDLEDIGEFKRRLTGPADTTDTPNQTSADD